MADRTEAAKFDPKAVVIPEGYDIILVPIGDSDHVEAFCSQCNGASPETAPACVYCGTGRTHYEYKKLDEPDPKPKKVGSHKEMSDKVKVDVKSMEGQVRARHVTIGEESVVGDIVGGEDVYMDAHSSAGFVFSPMVNTKANVTISHLATRDLNTDGPIIADTLKIYDGGRLELHMGSQIGTLMLGKDVEAPNWIISMNIKNTIQGDFPRPKIWEK